MFFSIVIFDSQTQSTSAIDKFTYFCNEIAARSRSIISRVEVLNKMLH